MPSREDLIELAKSCQWNVTQTTKGHWRFVPVDKSKPIVIMSGTPGDFRAMIKAVCQLRRSGLQIP